MSNETITAVIQPDGTVKEVNPMGLKPAETFNHPQWEYKRADWERAEQNRKVWHIDYLLYLSKDIDGKQMEAQQGTFGF